MPIEPDLLGQLLDSHATALALYARQLCRDPEQAVQQAFAKLAAQSKVPEAPLNWLYTVVRNEAIGIARSDQRRRRREREAAAADLWFEPTTDGALDAQTAADALAALPETKREIVTAHLWGGLSFREIGEMLGISPSTTHRRYQEAIVRLREKLGASCPNE